MIRVKKYYRVILSVLLVLSLAVPTFAEMTKLKMTDGVIEMQFYDKKAETGTTYKTVGWIVHEKVAPGLNAAQTQAYGYMEQQQKGSEDLGNGRVLTDFEITMEEVTAALNKAKLADKVSGTTVYLDSVFTVCKDGKSNGKLYWTYDQIKGAAEWGGSTIEDLKYYYNRPVPIASALHPLYKEIRINGKVLPREKIKELNSGEGYDEALEQTYTYNGKIVTLKQSFVYKESEKSKKIEGTLKTGAAAMSQKGNMLAGGLTIVAEYELDPTITVEHIELERGNLLEERKQYTVKYKEQVTESCKSFNGVQYIYSEISYDNGSTWQQRSDLKTRNIIADTDTIIRFYYSKNTNLLALLNLTANPGAIERGKKETVTFTLDASASKAKSGISKYEFWFGDNSSFNGSADYTVTEPTKIVIESNVEPLSWWYGKVRITDTKGDTAEATAQVKIEELEPEPTAEVKAALKLNVVNNTPRILKFDDSWEDTCFIDIFVPNTWKKEDGTYDDVELDFTLNASESESTNGVGNYEFEITNTGTKVGNGSSPTTSSFPVTFVWGPQDVVNGSYKNDYWSSSIGFRVIATDSKVPTATDQAYVTLHYKYIFEKEAPGVELDINSNEFGIGETAEFTPTFIQNDSTYEIEGKKWEIGSKTTEFKEEGQGEIPSTYVLNLAEDEYYARQYIYYKDANENDQEAYAEVQFKVWDMKEPGVSIESDKAKYVIPTKGLFTVTYNENPHFTYPISGSSWRLLDEKGKVINYGPGEFPKEYAFEMALDGGNYIAEQTIYWWALGTQHSKAATCKFKLISPRPVADFDIKMQTSKTSSLAWQKVSDQVGEEDKQFRQLRIDLTPSIELNKELENPHVLDFTKAQIRIVPISSDKTERQLERNKYIQTTANKQLIEEVVTIKGRQYADIRIDDYGMYRVWVKVANAYYESNEVYKDFIVAEDVGPKVNISFNPVMEDTSTGGYKTYRQDDLHVRFKALLEVKAQDEDIPLPGTAELEVRYDYNANGDASDDGVHSNMKVRKYSNDLQHYINVTKNEDMNEFDIDMFDSVNKNNPILGKIRFEYSIGEDPLIPYFTEGLPDFTRPKGTLAAIEPIKKIVFVDNMPGNVKVILGSESVLDLIILNYDEENVYAQDLIRRLIEEHKDDPTTRIYVIDKEGHKELMN